MSRRSNFTFAFLLFVVIQGYGQSDTAKAIYSMAAQAGYYSIWTGRESLQQFTRDHPWSMQVDMGILKNTQHVWNYCNCYSENGVALSYINFANPNKLGKALAASVFAAPYLVLRRRVALSLRGSAGVAFLNKVYDSVANKDNIFFSTKMSFILGLGLTFSWRFDDHWKLLASAQFNHISNAGRKDPNEGMNFPGVNVGVQYGINPRQLQRRNREPFVNKWLSVVVHGFGSIRTAWADANWPEEKRWVFGGNVGLVKRLGRVIGLGAGGEYYYDGINEIYQQRSGQKIQTSVGGVSIQNYLFFGRLLFGQQFALYVTPDTGFQRNIYQRYFLEYEVKRSWYAGVTLKAHGDHSDYLAISAGRFFKL